ncbi:MAG: ribonuclease III [Lachnospiraceae bacterium]|nr:ribonuclease III [Lachnospiraceae bacterium]MBR4994182.1 ribonuclease III [Lachnospiraceae bacterium]
MTEYNEAELQRRIGYSFNDPKLLTQALTHSSFANEQRINCIGDYERLEFLGDAVLELVSSAFLFKQEPKLKEGQMTKLRSTYVCEPALAYCAKDFELHRFIRLGKGEENTGGRGRDSITADVCEAIIGAMYIDGGFEPCERFIHRFILSDLENKTLFYDAKTILQEKIQKEMHTVVRYETLSEEGPEHEKTFTVEAFIGEKSVSTGSGKSKKAAEQQAAYNALLDLKNKQQE